MDERNLTTGAGGPLQLTMDPGGGAGLDVQEDEERDLQIEDERTLTIRIGGGEEMSLRMKRTPLERLNLGNSIPVPVKDYDLLENKPKINGVTLQGDKTSRQLRIKETDPLTNLEIEDMLNTVFG